MPNHKYGLAHLGVNYASPPHELVSGMLPDSKNVVLTDKGLVTGRGGSTKLNSTAVGHRITSAHEFRSGSTRAVIATGSTFVYVYSSATGELVKTITGLTSDEMWQWVNFAGKAIGVNEGSDYPQYYTSAAANGKLTADANLTKGQCIIEWSNRIYLWGDSTNIALLTGSSALDPTDFTTAGDAGAVSQYVGDTKDPATGGIGFFDMLLLGKRNMIYKMYSTTGIPTDASSFAIKPLYQKGDDNIGFTSKWAITQVGNDILFLDGFDIKRLSGIQDYGDVETASIIPNFREYLASIGDKNYIQYTQFFHYKKSQQVWVSLPTSATGRYVFVIDYKFRHKTGEYAVFPMGGIDAVVFGGVEDGVLVDIYFGDGGGSVVSLDVGNDDDGGAIERYAVTMVSGNNPKYGATNRHEKRKQVNNTEAFIFPTGDTLTMTPSYAVDLMDSEQVRTSGNYTSLDAEVVSGWAGTGTKHKRVPVYGVSGNTVAIKWTHEKISENFVLYPSSVPFHWKSNNMIV